MLSTSYLSSCRLLINNIWMSHTVFYGTLRVVLVSVFYFAQIAPYILLYTVIQTGPTALSLVAQLQATLFSWAPLPFLRKLRNRPRFSSLLRRLNTNQWSSPLLSWFGSSPSLLPLVFSIHSRWPYIVIISLLFTLHRTPCFRTHQAHQDRLPLCSRTSTVLQYFYITRTIQGPINRYFDKGTWANSVFIHVFQVGSSKPAYSNLRESMTIISGKILS